MFIIRNRTMNIYWFQSIEQIIEATNKVPVSDLFKRLFTQIRFIN